MHDMYTYDEIRIFFCIVFAILIHFKKWYGFMQCKKGKVGFWYWKKNDNKFKGWFDFFCWYIFFEINKIYRGEMLNADWMWIQTQIKNQK